MANQYTGIIKKTDYFHLYELQKAKNEMMSAMIDELVAALLKKYKENPDPATRRLLIIHGQLNQLGEAPNE